jgi:hypothetical protein
LVDARADIWVLDDSTDDTAVRCRVGDEIHIRLTEDLSTGHVWSFDPPLAAALIRPSEPSEGLWWDGASELSVRRVNAPGPPALAAEPFDVTYDAHTDADGSAALEQPAEEQSLFTLDAWSTSGARDESDFVLPEAGYRVIVVRPRETGAFEIRLVLRQAWDASSPPASTKLFTLQVIPRRTLPERGCASPQIDLRVQQLVAA